MFIKVKRAYEEFEHRAGYRVLVDRIWPRGVSKNDLELDDWLKDIAPSDELRKWFNHDPYKFDRFKQNYFSELDEKPDLVKKLLDKAVSQSITLIYSAKDHKHNNAVALKEYLELHENKF